MTALALVRPSGERDLGGRREPLYSFDRGPKPTLADATFVLALSEWWDSRYAGEETAPLREISFGRASPGQVFRLSEHEVRERLLALSAAPASGFVLRESLNQYVVQRTRRADADELIAGVYGAGAVASPGIAVDA